MGGKIMLFAGANWGQGDENFGWKPSFWGRFEWFTLCGLPTHPTTHPRAGRDGQGTTSERARPEGRAGEARRTSGRGANERPAESAKIKGFAQPMTLDFKPNVRRKAQQPARPPAA